MHHLGHVSYVSISRGKMAALMVEVWKPLLHCKANWIHIDIEKHPLEEHALQRLLKLCYGLGEDSIPGALHLLTS